MRMVRSFSRIAFDAVYGDEVDEVSRRNAADRFAAYFKELPGWDNNAIHNLPWGEPSGWVQNLPNNDAPNKETPLARPWIPIRGSIAFARLHRLWWRWWRRRPRRTAPAELPLVE